MKKLIFSLCALVLMVLSGCGNDDDKLPEVADPALQELCKRMNTNVSSIKALVKAVNDNDSVTSVVPLNGSSDASGYTVSFVKSQSVNIYLDNGAGSRAASTTPVLIVKLDADGHYYWTLDGEWLLDSKGQKISAENSSNTPLIIVKNDGWYLSVDNGATSRYLGSAAENGRDSMFREVDTSDPDYVTFTLTNGTQFTLARQPGITISFDEKDLIAMRPSSTRNIGYTISGKTENLRVEVMWSGNVKAQISDSNAASGTLTITTGATIDENDKVMLIAYNSQGRVMRSISFEEMALTVTSGTSYTVAAEGGTISINIETNAGYTLSIPDEAKSWLSVSESRAMRKETITLNIAPNENASRSATVSLTDSDGFSLASLLITQSGNSIPLSAFPDENFRKYIKEKFDTDNDDVISAEEADKVTEMTFKYRGIVSLQGIEYFTNLTKLECPDNQLTSLDLSKNTALTYLNCDGNQLTSLDLSHNTALTYLDCCCNQLTSLNISKNTALTELLCDANQLTSLDLSNNTALTYLDCQGNQLTSLDVSKNTALTKLFCYYNQLTSLDFSKNTALTYLSCWSNQLTSLDVSNNTELSELRCDYNQLTSLDVSKNTALFWLTCSNNQLTSLDVTKNTELTYLRCYYNQLTSLDISKNTALTELQCDSNKLTSLDLGKNTALTYLECENNQLTSLDVSNNTELTKLYCYKNSLTSLDLSKHIALKVLQCDDNQLTSLDVSKNTELTALGCGYNQLTSLDVSKNTALNSLYCYENQLTSLDLSKNTSLKWLYCQKNKLTELDLSKTNMNGGGLDCRMDGLLKKLILKSGWTIDDITPNRNDSYIDTDTEIIFVD